MALMLEHHAARVVNGWETSDLAPAVRVLSERLTEIKEERAACANEIQQARDTYANDELEIDDEPLVSIADDGVWVGAWVWVPKPASKDAD